MGGGTSESRRAARSRARVAVVAAVAACSLGLVGSTDRSVSAAGTTFVVDSIADDADVSSGDGECATALDECTLRAAIKQANATPGHDTIAFAIPGAGPHRIEPQTSLPIVNDPAGVTIDGYSQPGSAVNTLDTGSNAVLLVELKGKGYSSFDGLYFQSSNNVVTGLALFAFKRHVRFWARGAIAADDNIVVGNFIGTDAAGEYMSPMYSGDANGVHIEESASDNHIGLPGNANRNVISGSAGRGVGVFNPTTDRNIIENNIIGLRPDGATPLRNWSHGVDLQWGASYNIVRDNVISGNGLSGVEISHDALAGEPAHGGVGDTAFNVIEDNLIGTDATGLQLSAQLSNGEYGVGLEGRGSCAYSCPPDSNDNSVIGNVIVGSEADVKIWRGSHRNVVRDNWIGVLDDGTTGDAGLTEWGVLIEVGSIDNLIEGNRISKVQKGIAVRATSQIVTDGVYAASGNTFRSNSIEGVTPGLGVDLAPEGQPTPSPDPALVQDGVEIGTITEVTTDGATVVACTGCVVELFETAERSSAYGQGGRSLGVRTAIGGSASFVFRYDPTDPLVVEQGDEVSALVTDLDGSTSEFSLRVTVLTGSIGISTTTTSTVPVVTTTTTVPTATTTTTVPTATTTIPGVEPVPAPLPGVSGSGAATRPADRCSVSGTC